MNFGFSKISVYQKYGVLYFFCNAGRQVDGGDSLSLPLDNTGDHNGIVVSLIARPLENLSAKKIIRINHPGITQMSYYAILLQMRIF